MVVVLTHITFWPLDIKFWISLGCVSLVSLARGTVHLFSLVLVAIWDWVVTLVNALWFSLVLFLLALLFSSVFYVAEVVSSVQDLCTAPLEMALWFSLGLDISVPTA